MEEVTEEQREEQTGVAKIENTAVPTQSTMWNDENVMRTALKMAQVLANSEIVPQSYRLKAGDCLIAIDMANRIGISPIAVMQSSQIVQGNFTWKGTACKAMIDGCGKYKQSSYVEVGERGTDSFGVYLQAVERATGKVVKGVAVTLKMAKDEGWYQRSGSKWRTMPELMMRYRAASFFMRTECANIAMGFLTSEEVEDIPPTAEHKSKSGQAVEEKKDKPQKANSEGKPSNPLTKAEMVTKYGCTRAKDMEEWLCNKFKKKSLIDFTDEETEQARTILQSQKDKKEQEKKAKQEEQNEEPTSEDVKEALDSIEGELPF